MSSTILFPIFIILSVVITRASATERTDKRRFSQRTSDPITLQLLEL